MTDAQLALHLAKLKGIVAKVSAVGNAPPPTKNKYSNEKTEAHGKKFDSKKEANRYGELLLLEKAGAIKGLGRQVRYQLLPPAVDKDGKTIERAVEYIADFAYMENGALVVEDVKGMRTAAYVIKRKMMLYMLDIQIREI
jgi:hypothetical protein